MLAETKILAWCLFDLDWLSKHLDRFHFPLCSLCTQILPLSMLAFIDTFHLWAQIYWYKEKAVVESTKSEKSCGDNCLHQGNTKLVYSIDLWFRI
jgi:hypothetical protein